MSKNINVNPGQYKLRGRERQGEDITAEQNRSVAAINKRGQLQQTRRKKKQSKTRG